MRYGELASQLLESYLTANPAEQGCAKSAKSAERVRPLRADGWVVCACGRDHYGCEGRPNECWLCRKQREGEPLNVADRMILARQPARQGQIGEVA